LYTKPAQPEWRLPASLNHEPVWYIGKADGRAIADRVWAHLGRNLQVDSRTPFPEPFLYPEHRWAEKQSVPEEVRDFLSRGLVAVYTVALEQHADQLGWPGRLEGFLLDLLHKKGDFPVLNAVVPI
jgi:hypothetical protein